MAGRATAAGQQIVASDPTVSSWVSASAGTGKTHVLTDRVLRLLLDGAAPDRILCLTFTRAAAAEMHNRLHERLGRWSIADDPTLVAQIEALGGRAPAGFDLAEARRLFTRVLETPGGLKIHTIHAFCEALLRRFPLEAGVAPHFQVMDERDAAGLRELARDDVLAADAEAGRDLLGPITALVNQDQFEELIAQLTSDRNRLRAFLDRHGGTADQAVSAIPTLLGLDPGEDAASILAAACADDAFDGAGLQGAVAALQAGGKTDRKTADGIAGWLAAPALRADRFEAYLAVFFVKGGRGPLRERLATKDVLQAAPEVGALLLVEAERLAAVRERWRAARTATATAALVRLGAALLERYEAEKRRQARLDYDDLVLSACRLLTGQGAAAWVLYKLDGGLDHILVDEAQDTNREQWEVIRALAKEFFAGEGAREAVRTMFAVGDVKQSIYSFQRADPQAFVDLRAYFEQEVLAARQQWRPTELYYSYRSSEAVLEAVDTIFAGDMAAAGLSFDDSPIRHVSHRSGQAGVVEIWPAEGYAQKPDDTTWTPPLEQEQTEDPVRRLAGRIGTQIAAWLRDGTPLEPYDRPITPGDVLILVQKRAPFVEAMVRELKQRGIPVAGVDRMVLTEQLAVMDLVALGRFLLLPADDLTLATVLKSPLIGFDDDLLFALAWRRDGSLWQALQRRQGDDPRFAAAHRRLSGLLTQADHQRPFELYAGLLGEGGGRRRMLSRLGPDAGDPIDEFLDLALAYEHEHPPSLQGFLHWLESAGTEVNRDLEPRRDEVRVMTVHGAKGLQAPIVFLADTCRDTGRDPQLFWIADGTGSAPLWCPTREMESAVAARAREAARERAAAERLRLFYVALTRAADRLYICGYDGKRSRPEDCWYNLAWRRLAAHPDIERFAPLPDQEALRLQRPQSLPPTARQTAAATVAAVPPLPGWAQAPAPPEPVPPTPLAPSRPDPAEPGVRGPLEGAGAGGMRRGQLVHSLLQWLPELPAEARPEAARRFLARPAHDLDDSAQARIAAEVLAVLSTPDFAPLFGPASQAEVTVSGVLGSHVVNGRIDRLLVDDSEVLVVDYKGNRRPPETAAEIPVLYLRQLAAYRALLAAIYPGKSVRCALLWTDGPVLMPVSDDLLDTHLP